MATVIVRHRVADYSKWKPVFDAHEPMRRQAGLRSHIVFRDLDDPSQVILVLETDDLARAREFVRSTDLMEAMRRAGVQGEPESWFCDEAESIDYEALGRPAAAREGISPPMQH